jgi:uncharacterized protein (DUF58 family)
VILTGRAGLVALIYVLPIAVSPWPATTFVLMLATLVAGVLVDVLLAGSPRALRFTRFGETAARLGQPVEAHLRVHNEGPAGSAACCATRGRPVPARATQPCAGHRRRPAHHRHERAESAAAAAIRSRRW